MVVWNSGTPFQKVSALYCKYYYYGFIYLAVLYLLLTIGFPCSNIFTEQQIRNNTKESPSGIPGASTEPENYLRFKLIVESEIGFLLEIYWYSCE